METMQRVDDANHYGDGVAWMRGPLFGKGTFGNVFMATLKNPKSHYTFLPPAMAVKSAEVSCSDTLRAEGEIMNTLKGSAHVILCFGQETTIGDHGVLAYNLLLKYGAGGTLDDRIGNSGGNGLAEVEVRTHALSILRGLSHIHGMGYVHCDLKPQNILLVADGGGLGIAKIGDFGLAKKEGRSNKRRKLMPGCWRGTPMYLSPEAVRDNVQETPSDIWALGCIVLEMLTGRRPWEGGSNEEILGRIGGQVELPEIPDGVSEEARDFLMCCLERKSMHRPTSELLLGHPFVDGLVNYERTLKDCESSMVGRSERDEFSSCCGSNNVEAECSLSPSRAGDDFDESNEFSLLSTDAICENRISQSTEDDEMSIYKVR